MEREVVGLGFETWPRAIGLLTLGVLLIGWVMGREGRVLSSRGAGIVAFELAEDPTQARAIIAAWGPDGHRAAIRSLILDYLWIVLYVSALGLGCLYVSAVSADLGWETVGVLGNLLAKGAVLAGGFDALENLVLLRELAIEPTEIKVQVARTSAVIKFSLVATCLAYVATIRSFAWLFSG